MNTQAAISLQQLQVSYRGKLALPPQSGVFYRGSLTAIVGRNGSGKSTLLQCIAGLSAAQGAKVQGTLQLHVPAHRMAYLPQAPAMDAHFPMDVRDCVQLGLWRRTGAWGAISPAMQEQVQGALQTVGMQNLARQAIGTLSSGQLQRVLFARLMVQDADLILLDEPFNAIDQPTTDLLLGVLQQWHRQGKTVLAVLHDAQQVNTHFTHRWDLTRAGAYEVAA
jgi:zinc/manganese transport system ATP-binding protein